MSRPDTTGIVCLEKRLARAPLASFNAVTSRSEFLIRLTDFSSRDISHWLQLHNETLPTSRKGREWTERDFAREFAPLIAENLTGNVFSGQIWLASPTTDRSKPAGTISMTLRPPTFRPTTSSDTHIAKINWLAVDRSFRRRGLATDLLRVVESKCRQTNIDRLELSTLGSWSAAIAFYESQGFTRCHPKEM